MEIYHRLRIYATTKGTLLSLSRNKYIADSVRGKKVLHIGCADFPMTKQRVLQGTLLHSWLQKSSRQLTGLDISEEGIEILRAHGLNNLWIMDAQAMQLQDRYEVIVAGDIIEHLCNPGMFLERSLAALEPNGEMILCVPSAGSINLVRLWLFGREHVHCDHKYYFSPKTVASLCQCYGYLPTKLVFTAQPRDVGDSALFIAVRGLILRLCKNMAPSIIMHFKRKDDVNTSRYFEWG